MRLHRAAPALRDLEEILLFGTCRTAVPIFMLKRAIMYLLCALLGACGCGGAAKCTFLYRNSADHVAESYLGPTARSCGNVHHGENPEKVKECIFRSLNDGNSFYAWFWLMPIDSVPAAGLLYSKNNQLTIAWYDSEYGPWGSVFIPAPCSGWSLDSGQQAKIRCHLAPGEKAHLFDLESFVELEP
jgi:hypothetical protein